MGPVKNGVFFRYFSTKLGMSIDGQEKSNNLIEISQEINGREPILSKMCITANVQETRTFLQSVLCKSMHNYSLIAVETWLEQEF
jgi:hypothetical protein